ncbi:STAS/SEC14 domain-containing protein [Stutzerimonas stutzeri]|uniref:STAS/SEC14 domain-containing protein n=1 Tax=Stutzerimonas stutzeri TaxID=316 RepID=A0ABD4Y2Z0_STUST|nr:STAS/SEC14 domain-containing protein [Stutzerimonas stutzeri]MDH0057923.1 STAS/SEC14 domain-containing protein [Stutzerimonas stutzeri]MDH0082179.1 STAS/SEC14 domain-containing protein [Stutzerimonas stutzeri]MDH0689535.1 STAS/SEC14 domain-containing protein [Stutzerimonas stutzeri]MDH1671422.1 STAS/SEC14 domain-containing protein [Stutzerimonas stutzeri]
MFQVSRRGENRIDSDFSGKLDSQAMRAALDDLLFKSEGISHGRMLYRIGNFDLPTLGAVGVELSRLPQLLRFIRRFDRCAVIAGKDWLRRISEVEGLLIPGLTIKAFDLHQESDALTWLEHG